MRLFNWQWDVIEYCDCCIHNESDSKHSGIKNIALPSQSALLKSRFGFLQYLAIIVEREITGCWQNKGKCSLKDNATECFKKQKGLCKYFEWLYRLFIWKY